MYGFPGFTGYWPQPDDASTDPLKSPLKSDLPSDWDGRVKYVEWVRTNFSRGMLALLYKLSHDADRLKIERGQCDAIIQKEREDLAKAKGKK